MCFFEDHAEVGVVHGSARHVDSKGRVVADYLTGPTDSGGCSEAWRPFSSRRATRHAMDQGLEFTFRGLPRPSSIPSRGHISGSGRFHWTVKAPPTWRTRHSLPFAADGLLLPTAGACISVSIAGAIRSRSFLGQGWLSDGHSRPIVSMRRTAFDVIGCRAYPDMDADITPGNAVQLSQVRSRRQAAFHVMSRMI